MNLNPIGGDDSNLNPQDATGVFFADKNIKPTSNDNRSPSYSGKIPPRTASESLEKRKTSIQTEALEMRKTATKRSITILVVGLVAGAIAGIVGGALALAGIV